MNNIERIEDYWAAAPPVGRTGKSGANAHRVLPRPIKKHSSTACGSDYVGVRSKLHHRATNLTLVPAEAAQSPRRGPRNHRSPLQARVLERAYVAAAIGAAIIIWWSVV